jgi:hypothetical protein
VIALGKEGQTIGNISITTEISIPLTHKAMDFLQKKVLVLLPGLLLHLTSFNSNLVIFIGAEHMEVKWVPVQVNWRMS